MKRTVWILLAAAMLLSLLCLGAALADEVTRYDLWLGSTQVTSENQNDIFGDGKASFDGYMLTLNEPEITGYKELNNGETCTIYCGSSLIINGNYHMTEPNADYGLYVYQMLHVGEEFHDKSNFTFYGNFTGVYVNMDLYFWNAGTFKAVGKKGYGVFPGKLDFSIIPYDSIEFEGKTAAMGMCDCESLRSGIDLLIPENGSVGEWNITEEDGSEAKHVKFSKKIEYYNIWIGDTQVTSGNWFNIKNSNGQTVGGYNYESGKLNIYGPITGTHTEGDATYKVFAKDTNLILAGDLIMSEAEADYGIGVSGGSLTFESGKFRLTGLVDGIYAENDITVNEGTFTATGNENGVRTENTIRVKAGSFTAEGTNGYGVSCAAFTTEGVPDTVTLRGCDGAITAEEITISSDFNQIISPEGCIVRDGCIYEADGVAVANEVIIKDIRYNVWLGETQVTMFNQTDILGDGKTSYDPLTNTLTLDEPVITGTHDGNKIDAKDMDLTIKGSYHMPEDEDIPNACVNVDMGSLTLEGDFAFFKAYYGLSCVYGTLTVRSGKLQCGNSNTSPQFSVMCDNFVVKNDVDSVDLYSMYGNTLFVWNDELTLDSEIELAYPLIPSYTFNYHWFVYAKGDTIQHFQHISLLNTKHPILYLGDTKVTEENKNDILGDGKARFDFQTRTLTLNKPTIIGSNHNCTIFALGFDLTVNGSFHMYMTTREEFLADDTDAVRIEETTNETGIYVRNGSLTLNGDFSFKGIQMGIQVDGDLTLKGSVSVIGINSVGAYTDGTLTVRDAGIVDAYGRQAGLIGKTGITIRSSVGFLVVQGGTYALNTKKLELIQEGTDPITLCQPLNGGFQINKGILDANGNKVTRAIFGQYYNVAVGDKLVTAANANDILGDKTASYDPTTRTLTLNKAIIDKPCSIPNTGTALIYANHQNLTVKGEWFVSSSGVDYGILVEDGNLTIDGTLSLMDSKTAVCARDGDVIVAQGGTLNAFGKETGLKANSINLQAANCRARMKGETYAVYLNAETDLIVGITSILVPTEGTARDHTVYNSNGVIAKDVMLGAEKYGIWLGSTQINSAIQDDVFGDGTASYDPETNTLTLNNPEIPGHSLWMSREGETYSSKIYIDMMDNLTIRGSYEMPCDSSFGIATDDTSLTLEGSFCFRGTVGGIDMNDGDLNLRYGTLKAYGDQRYGLSCRALNIEPGFGRLELHSSEIALITDIEPEIISSAVFAEPENPVFRYGTIYGQGHIFVSDKWSVYESNLHPLAVKDFIISSMINNQFEGSGTASDPILIKSVRDWNNLASAVNSGGFETQHIYFQLKGSFPVMTSVGTSEHPFSGIFEGGVTGSIMDVEISSGNTGAAPFAYIDGATIKNIRATGTVSGGIHCAGLVGVARGTNLIENCVVDVNVTTSGTHCGGVIGHGTTSRTTLRGCRFTGSISGATYAGTLWGWSDDGARPVITDCLDDSDSTYPIGLGLFTSQSVSNTYYTKAGKTAGTQRSWSNRGKQAFAVTAEEDVFMYPGDAASYYLLSDIEAYQTGMIVNHVFYAGEGDILDMLLDATSYNHLENFFRANDVEMTPRYNTWRFTMPGEPVTITVFRRPLFRNAGEGTASEPFAIRTAAQWAELAAYIEDGYDTTGVYFEQIDDFSTSVMIGTESNPFQGIYNGGGNTLNFSVSSAPADCAPFRNIRNARISNLRTAGTIQTGNRWAAGLAVNCYDTCAITDCRSSVVIQSSVSGDGTHAGFISVMKDNSSVTFSGCVFDGAIKGSGTTTLCGGFVGYVRAGGSLTVRNSVSAPSAFETGSSQNFSRSANGTTINLENSYYLRTAANDQGVRGYGVTVNEGVKTIGYGSETASYGISGITAYGTGLVYGGTFYAGEGETINLSLANGGSYIDHFTVNAGTLVRNGGSWILTMPGENVRISAMWIPTFGSVDFTLPAALQTVGAEAFEGMKASVVYVPDTCTTVGAYAFRNCRFLVQIRLPKDCEIADTAFSGCYSLIAIFAPAGGTTETWAKEHGIPFVPTDRIDIVIHV